jgi:hypothetical protein
LSASEPRSSMRCSVFRACTPECAASIPTDASQPQLAHQRAFDAQDFDCYCCQRPSNANDPSSIVIPAKAGIHCELKDANGSPLVWCSGVSRVEMEGAGVTDGFPFLPLHWTDCESALRPVPNVDKECNGRASGPSIALQAYVCTASPQRFERSTPANEGGQDE